MARRKLHIVDELEQITRPTPADYACYWRYQERASRGWPPADCALETADEFITGAAHILELVVSGSQPATARRHAEEWLAKLHGPKNAENAAKAAKK